MELCGSKTVNSYLAVFSKKRCNGVQKEHNIGTIEHRRSQYIYVSLKKFLLCLLGLQRRLAMVIIAYGVGISNYGFIYVTSPESFHFQRPFRILRGLPLHVDCRFISNARHFTNYNFEQSTFQKNILYCHQLPFYFALLLYKNVLHQWKSKKRFFGKIFSFPYCAL